MGFPLEAARAALASENGNVERAVQRLLEGGAMEDEDAAPPAPANNLSPIYAGGQWHYPRDADEAAEMQMQAADEEEAANGPQLAGGSPPIETVDICDSQR